MRTIPKKYAEKWPTVRGFTAIFPANTAETIMRENKIVCKLALESRGSRPRLNFSRSKDKGKRDTTVSQTSENMSEIVSRLAPADGAFH